MKEVKDIMATSLSKGDLVRTIEESIQSEYDAIELYTQIADSIPIKKISQLLNDIANEEKAHIGELTYILNQLDSSFNEFVDKGFNEQKNKI